MGLGLGSGLGFGLGVGLGGVRSGLPGCGSQWRVPLSSIMYIYAFIASEATRGMSPLDAWLGLGLGCRPWTPG